MDGVICRTVEEVVGVHMYKWLLISRAAEFAKQGTFTDCGRCCPMVSLLCPCVLAGDKIASCVESFPSLGLEASLHPITRGVVRIQLTITPEFVWKVGGWAGTQT